MRFLIDECLSPTLCDVAHEAGHLAFHVAHRGLSGARDYRLREVIVHEELILVTNNWRDLDQFLGKAELHPGIMIMKENVPRERQKALFSALLAAAVKITDLINKILEVDNDENVQAYERPTVRSN